MNVNYSDKDAIIRKVTEALTSFHDFEVGDRALVTNAAYTNLKRFDVATITHKYADTALVVTARGEDGSERRGTVHPEQLRPIEPIGEDIEGNTVHMYDYVEGVNEHVGELMLVVGVNEDGEGITHAVKIRMEPTVETHVNTIVSLENTVLSTVEEWRQPRAGDVVEFMEVAQDVYGDDYNDSGEYALVRGIYGDTIYVRFDDYDDIQYDFQTPIKTVLRR